MKNRCKKNPCCGDPYSCTLNTRPAAPVEGLETVSYQYKIPRNGHWDNLPSDWTADECKAYDKKETRELVTRSQAEAVIAAKDENIADLENELSSFRSSFKEQTSLKADNAALTAMVKELSEDRDSWRRVSERLERDSVRQASEMGYLSTQLAAARKALKWYANPEIYRSHPHGIGFEDRDKSYVAKAALGAQP